MPATRDALGSLVAAGDERAVADLEDVVERAEAIVPGLVGLSLSFSHRDITLTYVADTTEPALPHESASAADGLSEDPLDEDAWQRSAEAQAAPGVLSSLCLPIVDDDRVIGDLSLYGSRRDTFDACRAALADTVGAWAPAAVANADLTFRSRVAAADAPRVLADERTVATAVAVLAEAHGVSRRTTRRRLEEAAARAGIPVVALALLVLEERERD
ncbi:GAF domain-containing protein [Terrabacter sp. NPDC000476]|uniref:GAF domain-containing protein n=1 Tax=Terrabacter sp. NPDC000476 TaxID=3154258 RepID=UPI003317AF28